MDKAGLKRDHKREMRDYTLRQNHAWMWIVSFQAQGVLPRTTARQNASAAG